MREYLDPVVKADQRAENVDDNWIPANNGMDPSRNFRIVFSCINQAGLKLTIKKMTMFNFESGELNSVAEPYHQKDFSNELGKFQYILSKTRSIHTRFLPKVFLTLRSSMPTIFFEQIVEFFFGVKACIKTHIFYQ